MKKYLAWFAVLLLLSGAVNFKHEQYANKTASNRGDNCLLVFLDCTPNGKNYSAEPKGNQEIWWERGYVFFGWPNGITIWALFLTMIVIAEQTIETRKSADATLRNSDAFINAERPWIKIEFGQKEEGRGFGLVIKATNCGKTPAAIVSRNKTFCSIKLICESLPANPSYKPDSFEYPKIVHPGDSCELFWVVGIKDATGFAEDSPHYQPWIDLDIETYMFGNVVYKDVLGGKGATEYETRWCYTVMPWNAPDKFLLIEHQATEQYSYRT
jgi:hypothetical protein